MENFTGAGLTTSTGTDPTLANLNKRARFNDSLNRLGRPQDFVQRMSGEADPGASQDLAEHCEELKNGKKSVMSHVATEQRRRDRINEGFNALRDLIPHKDKMDKATFLQQTVEYIKQLQAVMHQLLAMGAIKSLPEETQWSIRLLLPRKTEDVNIPAPAPAQVQMPPAVQQMPAPTPVPGNPPASGMMASPAQYLPYLLQQPGQPQGQPQQQQQAQQVPQGQGQGMMNQGQMQGQEQAPSGMHAQQMPQQQAQQQAPQQQPTPIPSQSSAPTVELKAPNNQSQTVQLDLTNVNNMLQLQALLQHSQMQMAQQQAVRSLWGAGQDTSPWALNQLQQMMQPQSQLSSAGMQITPETLNMLANQQALNLLMPQGPQAPASQQTPMPQNPTPQQQQQPTAMLTHQGSSTQPPMGVNQPTGPNQPAPQMTQQASGQLVQQLPPMVSQVVMGGGCGSSPQATSSEPSSPDKLDGRGPAKARKNAKVRRHTTASKIAKPPTGPPAPQSGAGRPEALSLSN